MNLSSDYYGQSCLLTLLVLRQGREKSWERREEGEGEEKERRERKIEQKGVGGKEKEEIG